MNQSAASPSLSNDNSPLLNACLLAHPADSACSSSLPIGKTSPGATILCCGSHSACSDIESSTVEVHWYKLGESLCPPSQIWAITVRLGSQQLNDDLQLVSNAEKGVQCWPVMSMLTLLHSTTWFVLHLGQNLFWLLASKLLEGWSSMLLMICLLNLSFGMSLRSAVRMLMYRILLI